MAPKARAPASPAIEAPTPANTPRRLNFILAMVHFLRMFNLFAIDNVNAYVFGIE
jgi:hypothetical protein